MATNVPQKTLDLVLRGTADANIRFSELISLLKGLGFRERTKGSHHIFYREGIQEIINIQAKGSQAKPYQVKQIRNIIVKYKLADKENV